MPKADNDAPGTWSVWTPGLLLARFIKRTTTDCYTQNNKALDLVASEKKIHVFFSHCKSMGAICCHGNQSSNPINDVINDVIPPPQWCYRNLPSGLRDVYGRTHLHNKRTSARVPSYKLTFIDPMKRIPGPEIKLSLCSTQQRLKFTLSCPNKFNFWVKMIETYNLPC